MLHGRLFTGLGLFSVIALGLQSWLQWLGQISHMLVVKNDAITTFILILVGVSQWTGLKDSCLRHGAFCLGCCWALMALLFVFGVMNLTAIAALTLFVAAEKLFPKGQVIARIGGLSLAAWGLLRLLS